MINTDIEGKCIKKVLHIWIKIDGQTESLDIVWTYILLIYFRLILSWYVYLNSVTIFKVVNLNESQIFEAVVATVPVFIKKKMV